MRVPERFTSFSFITYVLTFLFITGIFLTFKGGFRALSSISLILLFITAVIYKIRNKDKSYSNSFWNQKQFLIPTLIFFYFLIHILITGSEDWGLAQKNLAMKVPFLIFGFSYAVLPSFKEKQYFSLLYYFFILLLFFVLYTLFLFALNYEQNVYLYIANKVMETPLNHVRFSLMVAFGIFVGAYLWYKKFYLFYRWERFLLLTGTILLFLFIHVFAVRSGLLAVYLVIFAILVLYTISRRRFILGIIGLLFLLAVPIIAYNAFPTLERKVALTLEDLEKIEEPVYANYYSMVARVYSYKVAWTIFQESPVFGIGPTNFETARDRTYQALFPEILKRNPDDPEKINYLDPHNQFFYILVTGGIIGLIFFIFCFYYPLFYQGGYKDPVLGIHYLVVTFSFLVESTLTTQLGVNFSLIFIFLPLLYLKDKKHDPALSDPEPFRS